MAGTAYEVLVAVNGRIEAIDLARGIAVALMILSHGIKGLLGFEQIPDWGLVPIHLVTKFSSTLFILVFGVSLALAHLPHVGTPRWPEKRRKLLLRGLIVLFWYKVLTIVEMEHLYSRDDILKTLLYQAFPVYVEILGFYALALFWIPFALPAWKAAPRWLKRLSPILFAALAWVLYRHFDFWGIEPLKAILVEHEKHYTWGQLSRLPLILLGLLLGGWLARSHAPKGSHLRIASILGGGSVFLFAGFFISNLGEIQQSLMKLAHNEGKHPPELGFLVFSGAGALLILACVLAGGERLTRVLRPLTDIGKESLHSFVFHIFVIFVFYRFLLDYWRDVSYTYALTLTLILIVLTAVWVRVLVWVREKS